MNIKQKHYFMIPEAPIIENLRFRYFVGEDDFEAMVETINASKLADQIERSDSVELIRNNYEHLVNCDPFQDVLIAEVNSEMVAYSRVTWYTVDNPEKEQVYQSFGFMKPAWRRKGLGTAILHHNQERLRQIARDHFAGIPRVFESFGMSTEHSTTALLLADGYQPVRHGYEMVRPDLEEIPDLPLPDHLEVRPVKPEHYRMIYDASMEAFRDHWGFSDDAEPFESFINQSNFNPELWQVAWQGDQVVGMVLNFIDEQANCEYARKRGYTENIAVLRPWRKHGVARALIARSLRLLKEVGMEEAALGVDTQNTSGALRLYEFMGFKVVKQSTTYRKAMV